MRSSIKGKRDLACVVVAAACIWFASCNDSSSTIAPPPQQPGQAPTVTITIPPDAMDLGSAAFGPNPRAIATGTIVTWVNGDSTAHTVTSDSSLFDSGILAPGASFTFTVNAAGTITYHCEIHPTMTGTLEVGSVAPSPSPSPSSTPTYTFIQKTILTPHCNSCHTGDTASAGLDFTTWENLVHNPVRSDLVVPGQPKQSALYVDGQGNVTLSPAQAQALFDWIQAGALNN